MFKVIMKEIKEAGETHKTLHLAKTMISIGCNKDADIILVIPGHDELMAEIINDRNKMFITIKTDKIPVSIEDRQLNMNEISELKALKFLNIADYTFAIELVSDAPKEAMEKIPFDLLENDEFMQPFIVVYHGKEELQAYKFSKDIEEINLGREPDCDLIINHTTVSRKHAKIKRDWVGFSIIDLASKNGVFVNNDRIAYNERLKDGDVVRLGQSQELDPIYLVFKDPKALLISKMKDQVLKETKPAPAAPVTESLEANRKIPVVLKKSKVEKSAPYVGILALLVILAIVAYFTFILPPKQKPVITAISPNLVGINENFVVQGINFRPGNQTPILLLNNQIIPILQSTPSQIKAKIPDTFSQSAGIKKLAIQVKAGHNFSNTKELQVLFSPVIKALSSPKARGGEKITISGDNFDNSMEHIKIWISEQSIKPISASQNIIEFAVPYVETEDEIVSNLLVEVNGYKSNIQKLIIIPSIKDFYTLVFKAENKIEKEMESYIIKTDIGKLFLVGNKGTYSSIEQRARDMLSALNEVQPLADKELRIDFTSEDSSTGSIVNCRAFSSTKLIQSKKIIEILPDDASYYSTQLNMKLAPADIGNWLSAVLNDMVNLFSYGYYPINTGNESPGAKVLKKIWILFIRNSDAKKIPGNFMSYLNNQEKTFLANIYFDFPGQYRSISGKWIGTGDDLFMNTQETYLNFQLSIQESKNNVTGSIVMGISGKLDKNNTFYHGIGSGSFKEKFKNTKDKEFSILINTQKYGDVILTSHIVGSTLQGTYLVKSTQKIGFWHAICQP